MTHRARLREFAPSGPEWLAIALTIVLPVGFGHVWLSMDGDPGRHLRVGETILHSGLFYTDPFSFTKAGAHFVPYEWLSEVLIALCAQIAGLAGLVVLTGAILGLTYAIVVRSLFQRGVSWLLAGVTMLLVFTLGLVHWQARPHVFTLLCTAFLMVLIDLAPRRTLWSATWPVILLFALWANLHGGFLYGLCVLIAVVVGDRIEMLAAAKHARLADEQRWRDTLIWHAVMLIAASLAALLTPSGFALYRHTIGYLGDTYLVNNTQEYMSPDFHIQRFAVIAIVLTAGVLGILPRRPRYPTLMLFGLCLAFALLSARNLPLFGIVVLPLVAAELQPALAEWIPRWGALSARPASYRLGVAWPLVAALAMFVLARGISQAHAHDVDPPRSTLLPLTFNPARFPVRAVREARAARLDGRIFSEFTWGGYILYAWPEQHVFIDGQTDFYGDSITHEFRDIEGLEPGWRAKMSRWQIDMALIETDSPLAEALAHEFGWQPLYCDSTAILFRRSPLDTAALGPGVSLTKECTGLPRTLSLQSTQLPLEVQHVP